MDRRTFLLKTALYLLGFFAGHSGIGYAASAGGDRRAPKQRMPRIAIIIDDIGHHLRHAEPFLELNIPLTFSILPRLRYTEAAARYIHSRHHDTMLHQPMEPVNSTIDPGPGALFVGDDSQTIHDTIVENLNSVPFASGINNHMGSRFTAQSREMENVVCTAKQRDLFFVDSLTTQRSVAYRKAVQYHLAAAHRHVFLDHHRHTATILGQLDRLKARALTRGRAIAIGHPYPQTAHALKQFLQRQDHSDVAFVPVSKVLRRNTSPPNQPMLPKSSG